MATLTPAEGLVLVATEDRLDSAVITADGFDTITEWVWSLTPVGNTPSSSIDGVNLHITPDANTLTVAYIDPTLLFPYEELVYLDPNMVPRSVQSWGEIPGPTQSPDIVTMRPSPHNQCEWNLVVECHGTVAGTADDTEGGTGTAPPPEPVVVTGTYQIQIWTNYDIGRLTLLDELARRYP